MSNCQLGGLEAGVVQDIVDDAEQMLLAPLDALQIGFLRVVEGSVELHLQQIDVATNRIERSPQLVTHYREELGLGPVRGVGYSPGFLGLADDGAQLLVGEGQLVGELARFAGLVLELARLGLEEVIALFQCSHARSLYFTLARHPDSANHRVDL